ncbi:MAG: hypothetical protein H7A38_02925 [Chlamydiales bacterium]|nr:hypothetical protein [Chlamydiales bacterium]
MASRTEGSSRPSLHPALSQGLSEGKVSQMEINGKIYLVFKVEDGELADNPMTEGVDLEKVKKLAKLVIDTHKAAAQTNPSLRGKEITHITDSGARFETGAVVEHNTVHLGHHVPYLTTTQDLDWQQEVINLQGALNVMDDDDDVDVNRLPTDFKTYLTQNGCTANTYPVVSINTMLLDYTREKICSTQHVDDQIGGRTEVDRYDFVLGEESPSALIQLSNQYIENQYTVQHVWQTFVNTLDGHEPPLYNPPFQRDDIDTLSTASTTNDSGEEEETELFVRPGPGDDLIIDSDDEEGSLDSKSSTLKASHSAPPHITQDDDFIILDDDFSAEGSRSQRRGRSPTRSDDGKSRSNSAPPFIRRDDDLYAKDTGSQQRGRSLTRSDDGKSRRRSRSSSRSPSPVLKAPPVSPISEFPYKSGIHFVEMPGGSDTRPHPRIDSSKTWKADRDVTGSYGTMSSENEMYRSVFEGPDYQRRHELYRGLELKAMNADKEQWDDQQEYQALLVTAEQKLAADSIDLTEKELSVVRQMIEQRKSAGGFDLLPNGQRYTTVLEDLKRYQGKGF